MRIFYIFASNLIASFHWYLAIVRYILRNCNHNDLRFDHMRKNMNLKYIQLYVLYNPIWNMWMSYISILCYTTDSQIHRLTYSKIHKQWGHSIFLSPSSLVNKNFMKIYSLFQWLHRCLIDYIQNKPLVDKVSSCNIGSKLPKIGLLRLTNLVFLAHG